MNYNGKIVIIAFPDTYVKMTTEFICKVLPLVGLGTKEYIKAGHAALILIENETGKTRYYDFGRYVTPPGKGRLRSVVTDAELKLPLDAIIENNKVVNLEELLLWVDANPKKTNGSGRLLASVCDTIDYKKALNYIEQLQQKGSVPYGLFEKEGSNCSRFVTDTILAATKEVKIIKKLEFNKRFTPSTVGNVEIGANSSPVFEVANGVIKEFTGSAFKENLKNFFDKSNIPEKTSELFQSTDNVLLKDLRLLAGIGSNAYFQFVKKESLPAYHFRIKRYNTFLELNFDGVYYSKGFNVSDDFEFTYDSHCAYCHVWQNNKKIRMKVLMSFKEFNSSKKERST